MSIKNGGDEIEKCKYCGEEYNDSQILKDHTRRCSAKPFQCTLCKLRYISEHQLKSHLRCHGRGKDLQCFICKLWFSNTTNVQHHAKQHASGRIFPCGLCYNGFKSKQSLWTHLSLHMTSDGKHVCVYCGEQFVSQVSLLRHRKSHKSEKQSYPSCKSCKIKFIDEGNLRQHNLEEHSDEMPSVSSERKSEKPPVGAESDSLFSDESSVTEHTKKSGTNSSSSEKSGLQPLKSDGEKPAFADGECNIEFPQENSLTGHELNHGDGMTPAPSESVSGEAAAHLIEDDDEKPSLASAVCNTDSPDESSSPSVSEHDEKYGAAMPLHSPECNGEETAMHVRRVHRKRRKTRLVKNTTLRPERNDRDLMSCPLCDLRFSRMTTFYGHLKSVHEVEVCLELNSNARNSREENLRRYSVEDEVKKEESVKKPFPCSKCEEQFLKKSALLIHLNEYHDN